VFRRCLLAVWLLAVVTALSAQEMSSPVDVDLNILPGDGAVAEQYAAWVRAAISGGRWAEAEAALERAQDFADVSSDISYLLAIVRSHENRSKGAALDAVRRGLDTDHWNWYSPVQARLLEAEILLRVRAFAETLRTLALIPDVEAEWYGIDIVCFRLRALLGLGRIPSFQSAMAQALNQYARDSRVARILLRYAVDTAIPENKDRELVDTVLNRLPLLLDEDPELAYLAAPFMRDPEEAFRLVSGYYAAGNVAPQSLPIALNLGVIDDNQAVEELFRLKNANKDVILGVWKNLRGFGGRENFRRNLFRYSGVIEEDSDHDGYVEARTRYKNGMIEEYVYDADQDGLFEWRVFWNAGIPARAEIVISPDGGMQNPASVRGTVGLPRGEGELVRASVLWDRYPAVLRVDLRGFTYGFNPGEFTFTPFLVAEIPGSGGVLYPHRDPRGVRLTGRALVSFAVSLEGPGREFQGALERITLEWGVPQRAVEYLEGQAVSTTQFVQGRPVVQRVDLDLDGRLETIRRFPLGRGMFVPEEGGGYAATFPESSESDWDGDGVYETGEEYFPDGSVARSWDLDKDGNREYTVISPGLVGSQ
jgi:hypothetical protein